MTKSKKILIALLSVVVAVIVGYALYYFLHYTMYKDYKKLIPEYGLTEEATEFKAISETTPSVEGMKLAAQNGILKLYVNPSDASIAVYDSRNGAINYTRPTGAETDALATKTNKNYMMSEMVINYFNHARLDSIFDLYTYCTSLGQYEIFSIPDGMRIVYTVGNFETKTGIVPQYISKEGLDDVLSRMSEEGASFTKKKYIESKVADDYYEMLEACMNGPMQLKKLKNYFEEAGYTQEEYNREMEGSGVDFEVPEYFVIPVDYVLTEDALTVSVATNAVEEYGGAALYSISMLPYFGAAGKTDSGYVLYPNGSGSISYFNTAKGVMTIADDYQEYIYGIDPLAAEYTVRENTQNAVMALFGLFFDDRHAIFTTIEDGAALATVTANISGEKTTYNNAFAKFYVRGKDTLSMFSSGGGDADMPIVEKHIFDTPITLRYTMLAGDDACYNGAANYYRTRLINEGVLTPLTDEKEDIRFYYDVIAGVERTDHFLGVRYRSLYAMTDFEEAARISTELKEAGIDNQVMSLMGWCNSGYFNDVLDKVKVPVKLGGRSGLSDLKKTVNENGGELYLDATFQKVSSVSKRYNATAETSRYYGTGYIAEFGVVNPATLRQTASLGYSENQFYLISPKFLPRYVTKFSNKIGRYESDGLALRDLGNTIHSDKKKTNIINRSQSLKVIEASLEKLMNTGNKLLVREGNDYTFAYASDIVNAPITTNDYYVADMDIPFYEMLVHGCINYAGGSINLEDTTDLKGVALSLIAQGASPNFTFTYEESSEMKYTGLNRMYATTFKNWKDTAVSVYDEVNEVLKNVKNAFMVSYKETMNGTKIITYSNGVTIYVNDTDKGEMIAGVTVPAGEYYMEGIDG